ncbi:polysaccharide biosynthesis protein [Nocardioides campestrisoli]|uniref:polysaccharide biosynthesis protein n=1 Tax=Nocardioides campestrisoli TaxID=2736757 RepID=UPI0015E6EB46|nr:polysaccharide biosynthesis protein [Nocardioides campestrisoli]
MTGLMGRVSTLMRSGAGIAIAMGIMNVGSFGFNFVALALLGVAEYSGVAVMMGLLLVLSVASLGLQATAARRISSDPEHVAQIEAGILRITYRMAFGLGALLLLLTPVINRVLALDDMALAALAGVAIVPMTLVGGYAGILQGERRWLPLGMLYVASGVPRLLVAGVMLAVAPSEFVAILAVALAAITPVLVGVYALRHDRVPHQHTGTHAGRAIARETLHNSQVLLAFLALSNVDLIVARNVLGAHDSGLYAGGLVVTKAMMFLPQFVVVVAFPAMASAAERTRALVRSLSLITALGLVCAVGAWVVSPLAEPTKYAEIGGQLWVFALLGTTLAMIQLLVYSILARQGERSASLVWIALVVLVGGGLTMSSLETLRNWVLLVDGVLLVVLVGLAYRLLRRDARQPESTTVG